MFELQQVMGHIGRDPVLRHTGSGQPVTDFPVAAERIVPQADGSTKKYTIWYKITVWGKKAESCAKYLKKGRAVLVLGLPDIDLKTGEPKIWTDKDGNPRASLAIVASTVKFIGKGADPSEVGSIDSTEGLENLEPIETIDQDAISEDIPF